MGFEHKSVLLNETIEGLNIKPDGIYVDGTLGGGGHAYEVCRRLGEKGSIIGIDQDEAAIEAADVVLMDDDVRKIASLVKIARKTLSIVHQNIVFALGVKAIVLILGAFGIANMWEAVFADVGVSVIAILNSMRTLHIAKK